MGELIVYRGVYVYSVNDRTFQGTLKNLDGRIHYMNYMYMNDPPKKKFTNLIKERNMFIKRYLDKHPELLPHFG